MVHIGSEQKGSWFADEMHFRVWKSWYLDSHIPEVCTQGCHWQEVSDDGSGNGLVLNWRQVITWTGDVLVHLMPYGVSGPPWVNSSPLNKMAAILSDDNFKCIFLNENDRILIQISLKFVPKSAINNKPALAQVMAWRLFAAKPLPEPMLTQFTDALLCGTRRRRVNSLTSGYITVRSKS